MAFAAWELAYLLRFHLINLPYVSFIPPHDNYLKAALFVSFLTGFVFSFSGVYHLHKVRVFSNEVTKLFRATIVLLMLTLVVAFFYRKFSISRIHVLYFLTCLFILLFFSRLLKQKILSWLNSIGSHGQHVLVIGKGISANKFIEHLERLQQPLGIVIKGLIQTSSNVNSEVSSSFPILGGIDQLSEIILAHRINQVFIALPSDEQHYLMELKELLDKQCVDVRIIPDLNAFSLQNTEIEMFYDMPIITVNQNPISVWNKNIKGIIDFCTSFFTNENDNKTKSHLIGIIGIISILLISIIPISYVVNERGFKFPYYDSSDSDFIYVGNALVFNNDMAQVWVDHPGYLQMMFLSIYYKGYQKYFHDSVRPAWQKHWYDWVNLFHAPVIAEYFNPLIRLARIYSYVLAIIFCVVIALFTRYMFNSWLYGFIAALFLSTSRGVFVHLTNFRPEILSSLFFVLGILVLYSSKKINNYTYIKAILVGFLFYCSIITKITVVPIILILPWLILFWNIEKSQETKEIAGFSIFFNKKLIYFSTLLVILSLFFPILHIHSIFNNPRYYNILFIANYILAIFIFGLYKIKDIKFVLIWVIYVSFGASIASSFLFYRYTDQVLFSVTNVFDISAKYLSSFDILQTLNSLFIYFTQGKGPILFPINNNDELNAFLNVISSPIVFLYTFSLIILFFYGIKSNFNKKTREQISIASIPILFLVTFVQRSDSIFNEYLIYIEILFFILFIIINKDHKYCSLTKYVLLIIIPFQFYLNYQWVIKPRGQTISRFCEMVGYAPQFIEIITNDHTAPNSWKVGKDRIAPLGKNYKKTDWRVTCEAVLSRDYEIYYYNVDKSYGR